MAFLAALLGLVIGSFLNVVIGRLRSGEKGWRSRSWCPQCHTVLRASELIPLVSYMALRGRCRTCKKAISWQYPLVEFSTMALFLIAFWMRGGDAGVLGGHALGLLRDWVFIAGIIVIFVVDLLDMVVFDSVTLPLALVAFIFNVVDGRSPLNLLAAAALGAGVFLFQYVISKGRWIGGGDIRIGGMMGMMLGFPGVIMALLLAYVIGACFAVGLLATGRAKWSGQMAFGTFLGAATVLTMFFGQGVLAWYGSLLSF